MRMVERIFGAIGGMIVGAVVCVVIRLSIGAGLTLLPLSTLLFQLMPGLVIGALVGFLFPRPFVFLLNCLSGWDVG